MILLKSTMLILRLLPIITGWEIRIAWKWLHMNIWTGVWSVVISIIAIRSGASIFSCLPRKVCRMRPCVRLDFFRRMRMRPKVLSEWLAARCVSDIIIGCSATTSSSVSNTILPHWKNLAMRVFMKMPMWCHWISSRLIWLEGSMPMRWNTWIVCRDWLRKWSVRISLSDRSLPCVIISFKWLLRWHWKGRRRRSRLLQKRISFITKIWMLFPVKDGWDIKFFVRGRWMTIRWHSTIWTHWWIIIIRWGAVILPITCWKHSLWSRWDALKMPARFINLMHILMIPFVRQNWTSN